MTVKDVFRKAAKGDLRITIYEDYRHGLVAVQGEWYQEHMEDYKKKHGREKVELIGESLVTITVAKKR